jgi:hypothetical protein
VASHFLIADFKENLFYQEKLIYKIKIDFNLNSRFVSDLKFSLIGQLGQWRVEYVAAESQHFFVILFMCLFFENCVY